MSKTYQTFTEELAYALKRADHNLEAAKAAFAKDPYDALRWG